MANSFQFQVVALDRYTKVFRDLNNKASKAARPISNIYRQVGALSRELHIDKFASGLGKVSNAAVTMTRTLGLSLGPLEALLGAGGIVGGLVGAGVATAALGVRFATAGFDVTRMSQLLGVSTRDLQRYAGAARLAGVDADAMKAAIGNLGDVLQNASNGRNQYARNFLDSFGLSIHKAKDGTIDAIATMRELSRELQRTADPHVQRLIASAFGLEAALPLLRRGPAAVEAFAKEAERLGVVVGPEALQWSVDFTDSLNHLKVASDGVANSLGARVVPVLTKVMDSVTRGHQPVRLHWWPGRHPEDDPRTVHPDPRRRAERLERP